MSQKRKQISLELKLEVLKRFKSGEKAVDIARNLSLAPTTVRTICNRDAEQIKEFAKTSTPLQSKQTSTKVRSSIMVKMESLLSIWIENQNQRRMPLSKMIIQNKALSKLVKVAELAREADFEGMEEDDINEILISHDKELNNEDLISLNIEHSLVDDIDSHDVVPEEKHLTAGSISKAMQLISQAMDIFADNDPDENRSLNVTRAIDNAINCYKEIYLEKKAGKVQQTLDNFVTKSVREPNQSTEIMIDLESSSSSN